MTRVITWIVFALCVTGCADTADAIQGDSAPPDDAAARASRSPDTVPTRTRRVLDRAPELPVVTPDGGEIVFVDWDDGNIVAQDLATEERRIITRNQEPFEHGYGFSPTVSPDGERVAYEWNGSGSTVLRIAPHNGGAARTILSCEEAGLRFIRPMDWSHDGTELLVATSDTAIGDELSRLAIISSEGEVREMLPPFERHRAPTRAVLSPDGDYIAFDLPAESTDDQRDVYVLERSTGLRTSIVEGPAHDRLFGWSDDGRHLLFESDRLGTPAAWVIPVLNGRSDGTPVLVKPDLWRATPVGFAKGGSFYYLTDVGGQTVHVVDYEPGTHRVTGSPDAVTQLSMSRRPGVTWSPDGRSLAYAIVPDDGGAREVAVHRLETGEVRRYPLPASIGPVYAIHWTVDGFGLRISAGISAGGYTLHRLDTRTGDIQELDHGRGVQPYSSVTDPNGGVMLFVDYANDNLVGRDIDTGVDTILYEAPEGRSLRGLYPSGDRQRVALIEQSGGFGLPGYPLDGPLHRDVIVFDAQSHRVVQRIAAEVPDSSEALFGYLPQGFLTRGNDGLVLTRNGTGEQQDELVWYPLERLVEASGQPIGLSMPSIGTPQVNPAGDRIAFTAGSTRHELWVMTDFLPASGPE